MNHNISSPKQVTIQHPTFHPKTFTKMNRKNFFKKIGIGVIASTSILSSSACNKNDAATLSEDCKLTGQDVKGPFFVEGTANVVNINTRNFSGIPMLTTGKIYSGEGMMMPIEGAKIEIWHADDQGAYHPEGSGDVSDYPASEITLRGFVLSEADGSYAFQSIRPGLYGSRARHIHYKITVPNHETLITQTYFEGDNRIEVDSISKSAGNCRIVAYSEDGNGGIAGVMDFHLKEI